MTALRLLLPGQAVVGDLTHDRPEAIQALADLYAYPTVVPVGGWVRATMVASVDGSATGQDGLSGALGGAVDRTIFSVLRGLADVIVVGAGTARAEEYGVPQAKPEFIERRVAAGQAPAPALALVTRSGRLPAEPDLFAPGTNTVVITCADADVDGLRARVGADRILVAGQQDVDPDLAVAHLAARGLSRVLLEGGPTLLARFEAAGRVDELCLTIAPLLLAGNGPRIAVNGPATAVPLRLAHLIEADGVLLGRWLAHSAAR